MNDSAVSQPRGRFVSHPPSFWGKEREKGKGKERQEYPQNLLDTLDMVIVGCWLVGIINAGLVWVCGHVFRSGINIDFSSYEYEYKLLYSISVKYSTSSTSKY